MLTKRNSVARHQFFLVRQFCFVLIYFRIFFINSTMLWSQDEVNNLQYILFLIALGFTNAWAWFKSLLYFSDFRRKRRNICARDGFFSKLISTFYLAIFNDNFSYHAKIIFFLSSNSKDV